MVHQALDDLEAPSPLAAAAKGLFGAGLFDGFGVEPLALVTHFDLQPFPPGRLAPDPESHVDAAVARVGMLEGVDAGFHQRELDLVDLIPRHFKVLTDGRGLRRGHQFHVGSHGDRERDLSEIRHGQSRRRRFTPRHQGAPMRRTPRGPPAAGTRAGSGSLYR